MENCILCKVLNGEFEGSFVYRGDRVSVLLDIYPFARGHLLVVCNDHVGRMKDLDPRLGAEMFSVATKATQAMLKAELDMTGANLILNDGAESGQEIEHLHIHIVPRVASDGLSVSLGERFSMDREALNQVALEIANHLESN